MNGHLCAALPVAMALHGAASGESMEFTQSFPLVFEGSKAFGVPIEFDPFDSEGGALQLDAVLLTLTVNLSGHVLVENGSPDEVAGMMVEFSALASTLLDEGSLGAASQGFEAYAIPALSPQDAEDGGGGDFYDLGVIEQSLTAEDMLLAEMTGLSGFVDGGPLTGEVNINGVFGLGGNDQVLLFVEDEKITGSVALTYVFSEAPTPGAAALLGLAGLAGARRKRA